MIRENKQTISPSVYNTILNTSFFNEILNEIENLHEVQFYFY